MSQQHTRTWNNGVWWPYVVGMREYENGQVSHFGLHPEHGETIQCHEDYLPAYLTACLLADAAMAGDSLDLPPIVGTLRPMPDSRRLVSMDATTTAVS